MATRDLRRQLRAEDGQLFSVRRAHVRREVSLDGGSSPLGRKEDQLGQRAGREPGEAAAIVAPAEGQPPVSVDTVPAQVGDFERFPAHGFHRVAQEGLDDADLDGHARCHPAGCAVAGCLRARSREMARLENHQAEKATPTTAPRPLPMMAACSQSVVPGASSAVGIDVAKTSTATGGTQGRTRARRTTRSDRTTTPPRKASTPTTLQTEPCNSVIMKPRLLWLPKSAMTLDMADEPALAMCPAPASVASDAAAPAACSSSPKARRCAARAIRT